MDWLKMSAAALMAGAALLALASGSATMGLAYLALAGISLWIGRGNRQSLPLLAVVALLILAGMVLTANEVQTKLAGPAVTWPHWPELLGSLGLWLAAWGLNDRLSRLTLAPGWPKKLCDIAVPALFGLTLLFTWELVVQMYNVPLVLLPAPSDIGGKLMQSLPTLWADFVQTFLRAVLPGWLLGSLSGFLVAILCDRIPFLARGLTPLGIMVAALPIVGIAPIMVMWFGFDWHSKVAVVVVMTFFPMLVNTVAGLQASGHIERDLMRSYGAGYGQALVKLRLPAALPFIFNALKINSTLALIGAIVAEFFGTPIVGMGFRISTEVGRLALDMVWAEIAIAAIVGSAFYGLIALGERAATFWHPSFRAAR